MTRKSLSRITAASLVFSSLIAYQPGPGSTFLTDPFSAAWMLSDTNGDGIADFVKGKVVVPDQPSAAQNAAAADVAARIGFATTGLTPPVVISASEDRADNSNPGPRIYIGRPSPVDLEPEEGGVFVDKGNLVIAGHDDAGLLAAAEAFAARAPYLWRVPGNRLGEIAEAVNRQNTRAEAQLTGLTYLKGKAGVNRAFLQSSGSVSSAELDSVLSNSEFANLHEIVIGNIRATNSKPLPAMPPRQTAAGPVAEAPAAEAPAAEPGGGEGGGGAGGPARLDLGTLYTMRGLFRGTQRMPVPSNLDSQLYVPAGAAGIAMANLAARMGMETTGITLPFATPADAAEVREIRTKSVVPESSRVGEEAAIKLRQQSPAEPPVPTGDGELRIVDKAFGRQPAVLVRGDEAAALGCLRTISRTSGRPARRTSRSKRSDMIWVRLLWNNGPGRV